MKNMKSIAFMKKSIVVACTAMMIFGLSVMTKAETTQSSVNQQITSFQQQLNFELSHVNSLYEKANQSQEEVTKSKVDIQKLEAKIAQSENDQASLETTIGHQMRDLQSSGGFTQSYIDIILSSNNLTTLIQRLTNFNIVASAEAAQVNELKKTQDSLKSMKSELEQTTAKMEASQKSYQAEVKNMQSNISDLQTKISSNKQLLVEMQVKAAAEQKAREAKLAEQAKLAEAAAQAAKKSASVTSTSSAQGTTSTDSSTSTQTQTTPTTTSGKTLSVFATAYSWQNVGTTTAMGIDLRTNPMCVAVDPSVIPLGSLLEVPGYGIAIADDTGGAIIGNHIDVHFPTVAQATAWGVKNLTIKILS